MRLDDRVTIATPEGVPLELVLAGLGSRFMARALDALIQLFIIFALLVGVLSVSPPGVVRAVIIVLVFLVVFAYDIPFEVLNGGRTVGKLAAGIRVVSTGGQPIGFLASATRTILRIADFLPAFYVVGTTSIVITSKNQRLGDLAASTIVTRDKFTGLQSAISAPITVPVQSVATWDVSAIDAEDLATIRQFLDRRLALPWPVRAYFGNALASRVAPLVPGAPAATHPEYLLEGVVVAKQARV